MARASKKRGSQPPRKPSRPTPDPDVLKGWQQIAAFLSQPVSVAQRWVRDGMPVTRQGRYVTAHPDELNKWLGREAGGAPLHVATSESDLATELKRGLAYVRRQKHRRTANRKKNS